MFIYLFPMFLLIYAHSHSGGLNCLDVALLTTAVLLLLIWLWDSFSNRS